MTVSELRKLKKRYRYEMRFLRSMEQEEKSLGLNGIPADLALNLDRQRREVARIEKLLIEATR